MWISCIKFSKLIIAFIILGILLCSISCYFLFFYPANKPAPSPLASSIKKIDFNAMINENLNNSNSQEEDTTTEKKKYIKWFEFKTTYDVLVKTSKLDIDSHTKNEAVTYNWIELISYLACKYGNDFNKFKQDDLDKLVARLKNGETMEEITQNMKLYSYYYEGYEAVLSQFIGDYQIQKPSSSKQNSTTTNTTNNIASNNITSNSTTNLANTSGTNTITESEYLFNEVYGIKAFHPLARNYSYSHYDDFGNSRSYGYKRLHLGNDLMGSIGTPVIAVESGIVEAARLESIWWMENWHS